MIINAYTICDKMDKNTFKVAMDFVVSFACRENPVARKVLFEYAHGTREENDEDVVSMIVALVSQDAPVAPLKPGAVYNVLLSPVLTNHEDVIAMINENYKGVGENWAGSIAQTHTDDDGDSQLYIPIPTNCFELKSDTIGQYYIWFWEKAACVNQPELYESLKDHVGLVMDRTADGETVVV